MENNLQKKILSLVSFFKNGAKYSELKPKEIDLEDDLFNYHLQHLVKKGFLKKDDGIYTLTQTGKSFVTNVDEITLEKVSNYKVSIYLLVVKDKKVLLHRRLKHPQYGYVGLPAGKKAYGEKLEDAAKRELKEETDLFGDIEIVGNLHQIRRNREGDVIEDGVFYVCKVVNVEGTLREKFQDGENFWWDFDKIKDIKLRFKPSLDFIIEKYKNFEEGYIQEFEPPIEKY